jgi:glycosyltransferase involved in cell wall biosynthesis
MSDAGRRYCVVTPYYKEDRSLLLRCMNSVRRQTVKADHILVADGFPQEWLLQQPVRHVALDKPHGDYGDFARGVGALMAVAEKYDAICFLDADNWYDDGHIEACLAAAGEHPDRAYVAAQRRFIRPDGSAVTTGRPAELPRTEHVDTNCYFFLPGSYHFLPRWCTIPRELSQSGDHLFYLSMKLAGVTPAVVPEPTVNYLCMFENIYRLLGEEPPPGAKPMLQWQDLQDWLNRLTPPELDRVRALTGVPLSQQ